MWWYQDNQKISLQRKPCCYGADVPPTVTRECKYATSQRAGGMAKPSCPLYTETGEEIIDFDKGACNSKKAKCMYCLWGVSIDGG